MGFAAPLGVRGHHVRMIGVIATLGLTVALFVSDLAFTDDKIKVFQFKQCYSYSLGLCSNILTALPFFQRFPKYV